MEKQIILEGKIKTDYIVSDSGYIYSKKFERKIKLRHNKVTGGYHIVRLYVSGAKHDVLVARIVAQAFVDNPENKPQVNHEDGNKDNNCASNLQWVTQSENIKHAYENKLMTKSYKDCYNAKLTESQVARIRRFLSYKDMTQREIAEMFMISEQVISSIKHGRSYKGVGLIDDGLAVDINTLKPEQI